jgi:alpha-glucosidase
MRLLTRFKVSENKMGHHIFRALVIAALCSRFLPLCVAASDPTERSDRVVKSPGGDLAFYLLESDGHLQYKLVSASETVIEPSIIGIVVDGVDMGQGATVEKVEPYEINERYPCRGVHSVAINRCRGAKFSLLNKSSNARLVLEVRAFDDGVAFRHIVPGAGTRTPDAATEFKIPSGSNVWHHDLRGHYEGVHTNEPIESIGAGKWIAPPMTFRLPGDRGYAAITEAGLVNYAGMALKADGDRVVQEQLGHAQPVGRPFELRFSESESERLSHAATINGEIITPWRVVIVGKDLNSLVNCDIVQNVSAPENENLFPQGVQTDWIKPGRCVWKFLDGGDNSLEGMFDFSRWAGELGFEYNLIEGFWQRWSEDELRSLVDYSRKQNVGIWLWKDSRKLRTPESREEFFGLCQKTGVVGVKIDFLDHEAKEVIDLYQVLLKEAAEHRLMVDFHGSNKPAGESRSWPNELTREGVRGLEASQLQTRSRHNATLPFTRYLAGPGDYTPVVFGSRRGDTSAAHQIATAAVFTSPLLVYGGHPKSLLESPAVEMIKSIPCVWDETVVVPASEIGQVAAIARRHGDQWFLAVLGGPESRKLTIPLRFLDSSTYRAMLVRDGVSDPTEVKIENVELTSADSLQLELREGGGFIGRFSPQAAPASAGGSSE